MKKIQNIQNLNEDKNDYNKIPTILKALLVNLLAFEGHQYFFVLAKRTLILISIYAARPLCNRK